MQQPNRKQIWREARQFIILRRYAHAKGNEAAKPVEPILPGEGYIPAISRRGEKKPPGLGSCISVGWINWRRSTRSPGQEAQTSKNNEPARMTIAKA